MRAFLILLLSLLAADCHASSWYYCDPLHAYYPYVLKCPVPWRETPAVGDSSSKVEPTPNNVKPDVRSAVPMSSDLFQRGLADRQSWETWVAAQAGDLRAGADYWASHRSLPNPGSCSGPGSSASSTEWTSGCAAAQNRLAATDVLRKTQPEYRRGWNSLPPPQAKIGGAEIDQSPPVPVPSEGASRNRMLSWSVKDDGDHKAYLIDGTTITLAATKKADGGDAPSIRIKLASGDEVEVVGEEGLDTAMASFGVGKFDPAGNSDQIIFTSYSGGAHCCTNLKVIEYLAGTWKVLNIGSFQELYDGFPADVDGDGALDIVTTDDSFAYAFAPFSDSLMPPRVFNVINAVVKDVSASGKFASLYRSDIANAQTGCLAHNNGACAAFVADAARLGRRDEAWKIMLANYDSQSSWGLPDGCLVPWQNGSCPPDQILKFTGFPEALEWFLYENGYTSSRPVVAHAAAMRTPPAGSPPADFQPSVEKPQRSMVDVIESFFYLVLAAYFFPTIVALVRRHHNIGVVLVLNLFLGWTFLGWVLALVMASTAHRIRPVQVIERV